MRFISWLLSLSFLIAAPSLRAADLPTSITLPEAARAADGSWWVESMGKDVYLFRWKAGLYVSVFVVGDEGVLATDPINPVAAAGYRAAVARITDMPITQILYSHDHRDHIVGGDVLAPTAEVLAHPIARERILYRKDADIRVPTKAVNNGDTIAVGKRTVRIHYFGPNHSDSNLAIEYDTDHGRMLQYVDTMEIGIVPYRTLPDTDIRGYITSLAGAAALKADLVLGGHSGPGPAVWIQNYHDYLVDMRDACARAMAAPAPASADAPTTANGVIADGEKRNDGVIRRVMDDLRPKYGAWTGFDSWAPHNIQSMLMFLTIGN